MKPFTSVEVATKFDAYPPKVRRKLLALRELIFKTAVATEGVGELEESLKWGEPAFTPKNKSGCAVRIDTKKKDPSLYVMYFLCQTNLVETFRAVFPNDFVFEGNRALVFSLEGRVSTDALAECVAASFTYHLKKPGAESVVPKKK